MDILFYIFLFIIGIFGLAAASKAIVFCGTTAFFEAKYNFLKRYTNKG